MFEIVRHGSARGVATLLAVAAAALLFAVPRAALAQAPAGAPLTEGGADTCLGCHNSESMRVIFRTAHGQRVDPESPMAGLQCESCHGPGGEHAGRRRLGAAHGTVVDFGPDAATPAADQDAMCLGCHRADIGLDWTGSRHARNETGCAGCHSVHGASDAALLRAGQNDVCFDCHRRERADAAKPSAHPLRADVPVRAAAMVCGDCHSPHGAPADAALRRNTVNELCFDCHAEFRGPVIFDHAPVSEDCTLCHQPHGSIHAPLLTRRAPLLCQSCHSARSHPSVSFTDRGLPGGDPSPMLLGRSCTNCHTQVHGSNHPSGYMLMR